MTCIMFDVTLNCQPSRLTFAGTMEAVRTLLESSTIHGLGHISSNRGLARLGWVAVVAAGFSAAAFMIQRSFQDCQRTFAKFLSARRRPLP